MKKAPIILNVFTDAYGHQLHAPSLRVPIGSRALRSFFLTLLASTGIAAAADAPRERISLNDNWRFTKADPTNNTVSLLYDVRQQQAIRRVDAEADGSATVNELVAGTIQLDSGWNGPPARSWGLPARKLGGANCQ